MDKSLAALVLFLLWLSPCRTMGEVLIVADEFPAMEVLAARLLAEEGLTSRIVEQKSMPLTLEGFPAVVVYIHKGLTEPAEKAFIAYAQGGGRLILLHHSISSGKRQNRDWFPFLGIELREGPVEEGGYKWIEGVTVDWVNLAPQRFLMTNRLEYVSSSRHLTPGTSAVEARSSFALRETEVYLNHALTGPRTVLMGLRFVDPQSGKVWMQNTAGWSRPAGKGWVIYFMPGHTQRDFEDRFYGRIVVNAISAPDRVLR